MDCAFLLESPSTPQPGNLKEPSRLQQVTTPRQAQDLTDSSALSLSPHITPRTTISFVSTHCTSPQLPTRQYNKRISHAQPQPSAIHARNRSQEVQAQVHYSWKSKQVKSKNPDTKLTFFSQVHSNVVTVATDDILPASLSSTGLSGKQPALTGQAVPLLQLEPTFVGEQGVWDSIMMNGQQTVSITTITPSEPHTTPQPGGLASPASNSIDSPSIPLSSPPNLPTSAPLHSTPLSPGIKRPNYHLARPHRKLQDWSIRCKKPVLVMGDSNINRIPPYNNPDIQLDSYPGATIYHFLKVCGKTPPNSHVKILVLSIGNNNKDQDPRQTSIKQLKALYKQAQSTFPNANIYFPITSPSLKTTR